MAAPAPLSAPPYVVRWAPKARTTLLKIKDALRAGQLPGDHDEKDLAGRLLDFRWDEGRLHHEDGVSTFGVQSHEPDASEHALALVGATIHGDDYVPSEPNAPARANNALREIGKRPGVMIVIPHRTLSEARLSLERTPEACSFGPARGAHCDLLPLHRERPDWPIHVAQMRLLPLPETLSDWVLHTAHAIVDSLKGEAPPGSWYMIAFPTNRNVSPQTISFIDMVLLAWRHCTERYGPPPARDEPDAASSWPCGEDQIRRFEHMAYLMEQAREALLAKEAQDKAERERKASAQRRR